MLRARLLRRIRIGINAGSKNGTRARYDSEHCAAFGLALNPLPMCLNLESRGPFVNVCNIKNATLQLVNAPRVADLFLASAGHFRPAKLHQYGVFRSRDIKRLTF